jgi:hypothetical protein
MVMTACQQKPKTVPVDTEAEKAAISSLFDKFNASRDADTLAAFLTEDALCCGTDPSEFWNKQQMTDGWRQLLTPDFEINYICERKIKVAADGNSASVVERYMMPVYTPKIPWCNVYHLVKTNDKWMIDFLSCAFIPKNEDIPKLNKAVE